MNDQVTPLPLWRLKRRTGTAAAALGLLLLVVGLAYLIWSERERRSSSAPPDASRSSKPVDGSTSSRSST